MLTAICGTICTNVGGDKKHNEATVLKKAKKRETKKIERRKENKNKIGYTPISFCRATFLTPGRTEKKKKKGNFDSSSVDDVILSVERWFTPFSDCLIDWLDRMLSMIIFLCSYHIEQAMWSEDVAQMRLIGRNGRPTRAIAFSGLIFVFRPAGMSCYDPVFNGWKEKAPIPGFGSKFDVFIQAGTLQAESYEPGTTNVQRCDYAAPTDQWRLRAVCKDLVYQESIHSQLIRFEQNKFRKCISMRTRTSTVSTLSMGTFYANSWPHSPSRIS